MAKLTSQIKDLRERMLVTHERVYAGRFGSAESNALTAHWMMMGMELIRLNEQKDKKLLAMEKKKKKSLGAETKLPTAPKSKSA